MAESVPARAMLDSGRYLYVTFCCQQAVEKMLKAVIAERAAEAVRVIGRWGRVRAAYLFGSQVQGTTDQWSDIDIAVFVEGADEWDFEQLSRACGAAQRRAGLDIEMHVFPASSYENPPRASFAQYVLSHGVPLDIDGVEPKAE